MITHDGRVSVFNAAVAGNKGGVVPRTQSRPFVFSIAYIKPGHVSREAELALSSTLSGVVELECSHVLSFIFRLRWASAHGPEVSSKCQVWVALCVHVFLCVFV